MLSSIKNSKFPKNIKENIAFVIDINLLSLTLFITIHKIERVAHAMVYLSTLLKKTVC